MVTPELAGPRVDRAHCARGPRGAGRDAAGTRGREGSDAATGVSPTMQPRRGEITRLLHAASDGGREDVDALMVAIYGDLRRIAMSQMNHERGDHTLQPTAVANEAYLRLIDQHSTTWNDRIHFFAVASGVIRRILVDHARSRNALKRGGGARRLPLGTVDPAAADPEVDLVALDEALKELHEINERQARVVEMRFFGGLTLDEIAQALSIGRRTADREWSAAKAWLYCQITGEAGPRDAD